MILQSIWFFIWGLLWAIFFMTDGFDFGVGALLPFAGKTETDKRIMINAIGPLWDGNEVWLITAGGVTFAAFPTLYAVMFSSFYTPLLLILFALIIRGVSFEFRGKIDSPAWRRVWDTCIFIGSVAPAVLLGVAFANIFRGLPIGPHGSYHGNLLMLLNPYGLLGGALFLALFVMHGALWLCIRTEGNLQTRFFEIAEALWLPLVILAILFFVASYFATPLYANYFAHPILFSVILLAVAGLFGIKIFIAGNSYFKAWISSCVAIVSSTFFGIIGLYPNMFPSYIDPAYSLTAYNSSSSEHTLTIMLVVVLIFIPIVIAYQVWAYKMFTDKVNEDDLAYEEAY
ncbi:MAG: cytochrome d ubiquinol oxidase subunit II [Deltaproteobacteria bacterium]|nr:cytochrome d ubiquinol oxidase subunit II [Deltaproteobacteria bacterium]